MSIKPCIKPTVRPASNSAVSGGGGEAPAGYLVQDTFTDTGALASHTPDVDTVGGGWTQHHGTFTLDGDEAYCSALDATYGAVATIGLSTADFIATYNARWTNSRSAPIVFRRQDADNYWALIQSGPTIRLFLREIVAGTPTNRANYDTGVSNVDGRNFEIKVTANDESLVVAIDGTDRMTYLSAVNFKTEANCGLRQITVTANCFMNDMTVEAA